ncbi:hypothetical protein Tco_1195419 [Tanacetum coccineum]
MACSLPHTIDEIQDLIQKLMDEDIVRQKATMELAVQFDNASTAKDDLRKAYEKCNDIPQEIWKGAKTMVAEFYERGADSGRQECNRGGVISSTASGDKASSAAAKAKQSDSKAKAIESLSGMGMDEVGWRNVMGFIFPN